MLRITYFNIFATAMAERPSTRLEARMMEFFEKQSSAESLDDPIFARLIGAQLKADYLLARRSIVAELKTINADPRQQITERMKDLLSRPGAPRVYGMVGISSVIDKLPSRDAIDKAIFDITGRAVRRHLSKANRQIAAVKKRLDLPEAGGLVVLMNDAEPMIDAGVIGYSIKSAFETAKDGLPHITSVWVSVESHKIRMIRGSVGYPQLHVFKSIDRRSESSFVQRMLIEWGHENVGVTESVPHRGGWEAMQPIFDESRPTISPFE